MVKHKKNKHAKKIVEKDSNRVKVILNPKKKQLRRDFEVFAKGVERLEELRAELNKLDAGGFEEEASAIRSKLKNVSYIPEIEEELAVLKSKINGTHKGKTVIAADNSGIKKKINNLEKEIKQKKIHAKKQLSKEQVGDVKTIPRLESQLSYLKKFVEEQKREEERKREILKNIDPGVNFLINNKLNMSLNEIKAELSNKLKNRESEIKEQLQEDLEARKKNFEQRYQALENEFAKKYQDKVATSLQKEISSRFNIVLKKRVDNLKKRLEAEAAQKISEKKSELDAKEQAKLIAIEKYKKDTMEKLSKEHSEKIKSEEARLRKILEDKIRILEQKEKEAEKRFGLESFRKLEEEKRLLREKEEQAIEKNKRMIKSKEEKTVYEAKKSLDNKKNELLNEIEEQKENLEKQKGSLEIEGRVMERRLKAESNKELIEKRKKDLENFRERSRALHDAINKKNEILKKREEDILGDLKEERARLESLINENKKRELEEKKEEDKRKAKRSKEDEIADAERKEKIKRLNIYLAKLKAKREKTMNKLANKSQAILARQRAVLKEREKNVLKTLNREQEKLKKLIRDEKETSMRVHEKEMEVRITKRQFEDLREKLRREFEMKKNNLERTYGANLLEEKRRMKKYLDEQILIYRTRMNNQMHEHLTNEVKKLHANYNRRHNEEQARIKRIKERIVNEKGILDKIRNNLSVEARQIRQDEDTYREKIKTELEIEKQEAIKRAVAEQSAAVKEQLKNEFKQRLKMEIRAKEAEFERKKAELALEVQNKAKALFS